MNKFLYILLIAPIFSLAQVGINTTTPAAQLDIKSSNQATPANTDGLLIPKVDAFPAINPTAAQKGMLVYLTTASGTNPPGFYYWNNPGWVGIVSGSAGGTLDQAYDFGGAGLGRTITADTGAVTIAGTDGLVSTGTLSSGAVAPSGAGTRMVWNPNKSAFRAGIVTGTQWDNANIGAGSVAFGGNTVASGFQSMAVGLTTVASGRTSLVAGVLNTSRSFGETVFGIGSTDYTATLNGNLEFRTANSTDRLLTVGNAIDANNNDTVDLIERSDALVILKNGNTGIGSSTPQDKLHVVGNIRMVDGNQAAGKVITSDANGTATWQTPATVVETDPQVSSTTTGRVPRWNGTALSDGVLFDDTNNIGVGTAVPLDKLHVVGNIRMVDGNQAAGKVFTSDANGRATWQTPATPGTTLDGAYDFGGAGAGRIITADAGAVTINGTDGFVSTGSVGSGALAPSLIGERMMWYPRKAAFRAGSAIFPMWEDFNIGTYSTAFGESTRASGVSSAAFGAVTSAQGISSTAFGNSTIASGAVSSAFGNDTNASGDVSTAFGNLNVASGDVSTAFGDNTIASGYSSTTFGSGTRASGFNSIASGDNTTASGSNTSAFGSFNTAPSFGETVVGLGATAYTPSLNGATQFSAANAIDRLLVVGNAIDADSNGGVDAAERRDALVILKNGLTRLPSTTNAMITAADGKTVVTKEYLAANASGTLDQAYDFGGAGAGRTITADTGAVTIAGVDGFVSTGTIGSGALTPNGAGTRMVWNPNKGAFRAGNVSGTEWDNANIGFLSIALGSNSTASGDNSTALGVNTVASNFASTAMGRNSTASGTNSTAMGFATSASNSASTAMGSGTTASANSSTAMGSGTTASAISSTAMGDSTTASGASSTAMGKSTLASGSTALAGGFENVAPSFGETVIGVGATSSTPSLNGDTQFRPANATDRLVVVGNAIDANNNNLVDVAERNDALVILKNGLTRLPSTTNSMITASDGKAIVTKEYLAANTSGTLDQAYDFGGAGAGRTITADTGAVTIGGTDGLVSTGAVGSGAAAPSGAGYRMVWNPKKTAFRAGEVNGAQWDDVNIGRSSTAFGSSTIASGLCSLAFGIGTTASQQSTTAFGFGTLASGLSSTAFGNSTIASGASSIAFGISSTASASGSTAFGNSTIASGDSSTAFGDSTTASALTSTSFGGGTTASGRFSTSFGEGTTASGSFSTAFGSRNTALSYGETVLGIGATDYTPSLNGATSFRPANATDRLFVVGNAIDTNNNFVLDLAERSDALVILKNGNTGIGSSTPQDKLHVVGNIRMVDGNQAAGKVLTSDANGTATWTAAGTLASGTLDQAYDFGGAGAGRTITADAGAVTIAGTDGLTVAGNSGFGVAAPVARMQFQTTANATKTLFTQGLLNSGLLATTNFVNGNFTPGLFWNTTNNNVTLPKAGIFLQTTNAGSSMYLGTSNSYATGITNDGIVIDPSGNVGIANTAPATKIHVNGGLTMSPDPSNPVALGSPATLTVGDRSFVRMNSNGTPTLRVVAPTAGLAIGQMLVIECTAAGVNGLRFTDTATTNTSGVRDLLVGDTITFIWNGTQWLEINYSDN